MKQTSNWSKAGFILGVLFILIAIVQYRILYSDFDKFLSFSAIGILFMAASWFYNKQLASSNGLTALGDEQRDLIIYLKEKKVIEDKDIQAEDLNLETEK